MARKKNYKKYKKELTSTEKLLGAFYRTLQPKKKLTVSQWIEENFYLSKKNAAAPGKFSFKLTPENREIADTLGEESPYTKVVGLKPAQSGWTEIGNGWIGYIAHHIVAPVMLAMPNENVLKRASRNKIQPMIEATPVLKEIFGEKKSRDSNNSVNEKSFEGGVLYLAAATSSDQLSSATVRYVFSDEYSRFPDDVNGEGHPASLLDARLTTYGTRAKHYKISTPTTEGECKVSEDFEMTDKRHRFMPCPSCSELITFEWENIKWDKDKNGRHLPETAYLEAPCCGFKIEEHKHKQKMREKGVWIPTEKNPVDPKAAGFYYNALYINTAWKSWADLVQEFLIAKKDKKKLKAFMNLRLARTWKEKSKDVPKVDYLMLRREMYDRGVVPKQASTFALVAGVDFQGDRCEITVLAINVKDDFSKETYVIDHKVIWGDTKQANPLLNHVFDADTGNKSASVWGQLADYLKTPFKVEGSEKRKPLLSVNLDSGDNTTAIYTFTRRFPPQIVHTIKGKDYLSTGKTVSVPSFLDYDYKGKKMKSGAKLYTLGTFLLKKATYDMLNIPQPTNEQLEAHGYPPDYIHFPMLEKEYFLQLTAETIKSKKDSYGKEKKYFHKLRERNEALDCFVYGLAAFEIGGLAKLNPSDYARKVERAEFAALAKLAKTK